MDVLERTDEGQDVFHALDELATRIDRAFERLDQAVAMVARIEETVTRTADRMERVGTALERFERVMGMVDDMMSDPPPWLAALIDRQSKKAAKLAKREGTADRMGGV